MIALIGGLERGPEVMTLLIARDAEGESEEERATRERFPPMITLDAFDVVFLTGVESAFPCLLYLIRLIVGLGIRLLLVLMGFYFIRCNVGCFLHTNAGPLLCFLAHAISQMIAPQPDPRSFLSLFCIF